MQEFNLSDSFDNDSNHLFLFQKCVSKSLKPKFMQSLQKTLPSSLNIFQSSKTSKSQPLLNLPQIIILNSIQFVRSQSLPQAQKQKPSKIIQTIELIKKRTVQEEKPINLYQLFRKAEYLSDINHKNKKTVRFVHSCQRKGKDVPDEKCSWIQFSLLKGKGIIFLPDGRKIKANWQHAFPVGKCQITYPNGSIYYGEVNEYFQKQGNGYVYFQTGQKMQGKFKQGKLLESAIYYSRSGQIIKSKDFERGVIQRVYGK